MQVELNEQKKKEQQKQNNRKQNPKVCSKLGMEFEVWRVLTCHRD